MLVDGASSLLLQAGTVKTPIAAAKTAKIWAFRPDVDGRWNKGIGGMSGAVRAILSSADGPSLA